MQWRKSSYSGSQTECVEIGFSASTIAVRDTKNHAAGTLHFPTATWHAFRTHLQAR
ncbi:uncharacterized protein DUF397 [Tamaricihabitans halophyticus]|uniref:Uncharacterized protein DUF397 n=2 Tax=Tamaricihabitans halophyticus TaxID=1262583 RepID=A0A4R2QXT9_9PSEU|nr:uncharacterized protein DUF397 [Tamaricihabitans halophyticus]